MPRRFAEPREEYGRIEGIFDAASGQFVGKITPARPKIGGKWVRLFQDQKLRMMQAHPELTDRAYRILSHLEAVSKWDNALPSATAVAKQLTMNRAVVARQFSALQRAEFIIRFDGVYYLNPLIVWKGTEKQMEAKCRELFAIQPISPPTGPLRLALPQATVLS